MKVLDWFGKKLLIICVNLCISLLQVNSMQKINCYQVL
jgi:hypothetical protein